MDRSDVLTLVASALTQNAYGVWTDTETSREVFCEVRSATRAEYFEGGKNGLVPEYVFIVFDGDYNKERTVIYNGVAYGVYRTFQGTTDRVELYCERKGGVNVVPEVVTTDGENPD